MMWSWVADAMSRLSVALGKVAVIAFLQDVQKKTQKRWQRALLFFIAITNVLKPGTYSGVVLTYNIVSTRYLHRVHPPLSM